MAAEKLKTDHRRKLWLLLVAAVVAVVAVAWTREWSRGFEWELFTRTFRQLDPWWIVAASLFGLATYLGRALRWQILIRSQKPASNLWNLFSATAIGFTAIVLFGRPGELVRPYLIASKERLTFSSQMAAWLLERIYDLVMALLIFGFALARVKSSGIRVGEHIQWVLSAGGWFVGITGLACVAVFIALRQFGEASLRRLLEAISFLPPVYRASLESLFRAFARGIQSTRDWSAIVGVLAYSVLEWILIVFCYVCLFRASPAMTHFTLTDILIFVGFVAFGAVVQIPGVGGGMQLVAVVVLTELFGMPLEVSSGMAVVLWAITFVVIVPFGLLLAFHDGLQWSKLRHLRQAGGVPEGEVAL